MWILVQSYIQPSMMPMYLDCQSHTDLRMLTSTFGHMQEGSRRGASISVTVLVRVLQELVRHHLFAKIFTVKWPRCTHLQNSTGSGTPTTHTGMEKTATLEVTAATMLLLRGSGGVLRRQPLRTSKCAGVSFSRYCATESALNSWSSTFTNPSNAASIK